MPHPTTGEPAGQDEKDRIGAELRELQQAQADRFWRQQHRTSFLPDGQLEDLDLAGLRAEAEKRRVPVPAKPTKAALVAALKAATADLDRPPQE